MGPSNQREAHQAKPVAPTMAAPAAPKVGFVVPAHNEQAGLPRTPAAIQTEIARAGYPAEVIVVDNASADGTARAAAPFPGVRVVPEPVQGLPRARHAGFVASDGDLVANIGANTILPEGWLRRVLEQFAGDRGSVAPSGPYIYHDVPLRVRAAAGPWRRSAGSTRLPPSTARTRTSPGACTRSARSGSPSRRRPSRPCAAYGGDGVFATGLRHGVNHLWAGFRHRPSTREARDHRA